MFLDSRLRGTNLSKTRKDAWFQDQYNHPHESKHTVGQVLEWFDQTEFDFVNGVPKVTGDQFTKDEQLFVHNRKGSGFEHLMVQARMLLSGGKDGGFFIMIGQKRSNDAEDQSLKQDSQPESETSSWQGDLILQNGTID